MPVVRTSIERAPRDLVDEIGAFGVSTVHEAQMRTGLMGSHLTPIFPGACIAGTAVTVSVPPADNWMIHVAVEQCQDGDVLVVAPTAPSDAGYFGELLATALRYRGVRGLIIEAGCRDVAQLTAMGFPVWSKCVSAYGTVKETLGDVNLPVVCGGQSVHPGDIIVADDDGVVVVPRATASVLLEAARLREGKEEVARRRYEAGELSLDVGDMRGRLERKGLRYV
jgi:4-hydroxy-4-methyl-2-oxoglutarate aldolase